MMDKTWSFCCLRPEDAAYPGTCVDKLQDGCDVNTAVTQRKGILLQARSVACLVRCKTRQ